MGEDAQASSTIMGEDDRGKKRKKGRKEKLLSVWLPQPPIFCTDKSSFQTNISFRVIKCRYKARKCCFLFGDIKPSIKGSYEAGKACIFGIYLLVQWQAVSNWFPYWGIDVTLTKSGWGTLSSEPPELFLYWYQLFIYLSIPPPNHKLDGVSRAIEPRQVLILCTNLSERLQYHVSSCGLLIFPFCHQLMVALEVSP